MPNVVESVLERKLMQLAMLEREIDALRLAANLVNHEVKPVADKRVVTRPAADR